MLRYRAAELEGKTVWTDFFKQLVAVPMALVLLITLTGGYAYASPSVVKGDLFYSVKTTIENARYPRNGTSEDRIAYHLWLSERRYDEVNEILSRLGKGPLGFIPAAQAVEPMGSSVDDRLNQILLETLQDATQQVDYAFLISDEIRDVERVKVVKEQIRTSLEKQREFVKQVTPVLKEVKLQQKKKARVKKQPKPLPSLEKALLEHAEEVSSESVPIPPLLMPPERNVTEEVPVSSHVEEPFQEMIQLYQNVQNEALEQASEVDSDLPEEDEFFEAELEDMGDFLEDRFTYQDTLLKRIDEVIVEANNNGQSFVRLTTFVKPLEEEAEVTNHFFRKALTVHYENSRKILESELQELDKELIAEVEDPSESISAVEEPVVEPVLEPPSPLTNSENSVPETSEGETETETPGVTPEVAEVPAAEESEMMAATGVVDDPVVIDEVPTSSPEEAPAEVADNVDNTVPAEPAVPVEAVPVPVPVENVPIIPEVVSVPPALDADLSTIPSTVETVLPKTECEVLAEERCGKSAQKKCLEDAIKACEEFSRQQREKAERERVQREAWDRAERMKLELRDLEQKMERLQMNFKNSAAPEKKKISEELKASVLKKEEERKKESERRKQEEGNRNSFNSFEDRRGDWGRWNDRDDD